MCIAGRPSYVASLLCKCPRGHTVPMLRSDVLKDLPLRIQNRFPVDWTALGGVHHGKYHISREFAAMSLKIWLNSPSEFENYRKGVESATAEEFHQRAGVYSEWCADWWEAMERRVGDEQWNNMSSDDKSTLAQVCGAASCRSVNSCSEGARLVSVIC